MQGVGKQALCHSSPLPIQFTLPNTFTAVLLGAAFPPALLPCYPTTPRLPYAKQLQLCFWTAIFTVLEVTRRGGGGLAGLASAVDLPALTADWTAGVWAIAALKSFGGLLVATSTTFADNTTKAFSTAFAIIVTVLFTWHTGAVTNFSAGFMGGCGMVLVSVFLYAFGKVKK